MAGKNVPTQQCGVLIKMGKLHFTPSSLGSIATSYNIFKTFQFHTFTYHFISISYIYLSFYFNFIHPLQNSLSKPLSDDVIAKFVPYGKKKTMHLKIIN